MRERFNSYYEKPDFEKLWKNGTFVFDTNILLNLYRFPKETSEDLIKKLENDISDQLWMPHQVALEYQEGRSSVIKEQTKFYSKLKGKIKSAKNEFNQKLTSEELFRYRESLMNEIKSEIADVCHKYEEVINEEKDQSPDFLNDDIIRSTLDELYKGIKLGDSFPSEKLIEIVEEGKIRYSLKIPPGYGDKNKTSPEKFGDLIIWYQMMEYAKKKKKSIIFVTEDKNKEDWIIKDGNESVPRTSLVQEFYDKTEGQMVYIYDFKQFMDESEEYLGITYKDKTKEDIEKFDYTINMDIIHLTGIEYLEKIRPFAKSILLTFSTLPINKNSIKQELDRYKRYNKNEIEYEIIHTRESTIIGITIHYPLSKWPENVNEQDELINYDVTTFMGFYRDLYFNFIPFKKNNPMEYRRRKGSDTWHWCRNCSQWPTSNYDSRKTKPTSGELHNECKSKFNNRNCS